MSSLEKDIDSKEENPKKSGKDSRLRTGLLVLGSALFGGIAVVLWNRKTMASMQNPPQGKPLPVDNDAIY